MLFYFTIWKISLKFKMIPIINIMENFDLEMQKHFNIQSWNKKHFHSQMCTHVCAVGVGWKWLKHVFFKVNCIPLLWYFVLWDLEFRSLCSILQCGPASLPNLHLSKIHPESRDSYDAMWFNEPFHPKFLQDDCHKWPAYLCYFCPLS